MLAPLSLPFSDYRPPAHAYISRWSIAMSRAESSVRNAAVGAIRASRAAPSHKIRGTRVRLRTAAAGVEFAIATDL